LGGLVKSRMTGFFNLGVAMYLLRELSSLLESSKPLQAAIS